MTVAVTAISLATCAVSGWMGVMYFVLRHPGYEWRAAIAAIICVGAATLVSGRPPAPLRAPIAVWGAALAAFGCWALLSPSDDGWVIIAGVLFVVEGGLAMIASLRRTTT
jgi:hypothetical protein